MGLKLPPTQVDIEEIQRKYHAAEQEADGEGVDKGKHKSKGKGKGTGNRKGSHE